MKVTIIYAHPNPKSFNKAILDKAIETLNELKAEYRLIDLYKDFKKLALDREDFERINKGEMPEDVIKFQDDIVWADKLIFIFPLWWWSYPAILKGFIDRVFLNGFAYKFDTGLIKLLKNEKALIFMTTGGSKEEYTKGNGIELIKLPLEKGVLDFCGISNSETHIFFAIPSSSEEDRRKYLDEVKESILKL